ncbi:MAG: transglutaminaseTgpA domain-containing protein, partial [Burkholderiales bacterium]
MTRESRDTLFLLGVLGWTLAPQLLRVPLWCSAFALLALGWRAWLAWRGRALPSRPVLVAALLLAVAATFWQYRTIAGKEAGVTLLMVLAALKTLELRARRDAV